ncbi:unnamed protein product [Discula destructiva]
MDSEVTPIPLAAAETLETAQARHRKEARDLQSRITSKKKNATKKTRRGVNAECEQLERDMKARHAAEIAALDGSPRADEVEEEEEQEEEDTIPDDEVEVAARKLGASLNLAELGAKVPQHPSHENGQAENPENVSGNGTAHEAGTGAGKKRNRQKERLARRAAELEAAAEAAEAEAANQTDHRSIEKTAMLATFAEHGLVEHEIRPDGHCLFSAVADQLSTQLHIPLVNKNSAGDDDDDDDEPGYKAVRRRAAEYVAAHGDEYAGFLEESVESYVRKIRDTAEWGGQIELAAVANVYGVEVWVVQDRETEVVKPADGTAEVEGGRRIWLAYYRHGYGLGEHYNSLRKKA